jgi:hypothetical protein
MVTLVVAIAACSSCVPTPLATEARSQVLDRYLTALHNGDREGMRVLACPAVDPMPGINDNMARFGGASLPPTSVTWTDELGGSVVEATVSLAGRDGPPLQFKLSLEWLNETYCVVLGHLAGPPSNAASEESPTPVSTEPGQLQPRP